MTQCLIHTLSTYIHSRIDRRYDGTPTTKAFDIKKWCAVKQNPQKWANFLVEYVQSYKNSQSFFYILGQCSHSPVPEKKISVMFFFPCCSIPRNKTSLAKKIFGMPIFSFSLLSLGIYLGRQYYFLVDNKKIVHIYNTFFENERK